MLIVRMDVDIYGVELFSILCSRVGMIDLILMGLILMGGGVGWWRFVLTVDT